MLLRAITGSASRTMVLVLSAMLLGGLMVRADDHLAVPASLRKLCTDYCVECHSGPDAEARIDLSVMTATPVAQHYSLWRRVARVLDDEAMPPEDSLQPSRPETAAARDGLAAAIHAAVQAAAADPGPTTIRRLTNAEYDYCIQDLTGLRLGLGANLVSDSVGGSGFTNSATGQFMQDATLERYLETAKIVAEHAMIGAGELYFFADRGDTGLELSAAERIQNIYRKHGFRASAGEGAEPFGLERFARAFQVTWQYRFRDELGYPEKSLSEWANDARVEPKFALHIWQVLHRERAQFPLSAVIDSWNQLPGPSHIVGNRDEVIQSRCSELYAELTSWQARFAGSASAEEEAALLTGVNVTVPASAKFVARAIRKQVQRDDNFTPDLNNKELYSKDGRIRLRVAVEPASPTVAPIPAVIFSQPQFRFRVSDVVQPEPVPLKTVLSEPVVESLRFGENPGGVAVSGTDFVLAVGNSRVIEVELPEDCRLGELIVTARLDPVLGRDTVVRCTITDITSDGDLTAGGPPGRQYSSLLRDPNSKSMDRWEAGLQEFAEALPQISHREPTPSDRDPIPEPFNNTYNLPERNYFHTAVKYHRDDQFLTESVLPDSARRKLDIAWADLLTAFDYHNVNLRFAAGKFGVDLEDQDIRSLRPEVWKRFPVEVQPIVAGYQKEYQAMMQMRRDAEYQQLQSIWDFAERAWRRELDAAEKEELESFYRSVRSVNALGHAKALRATLVRVLVSPDFLYRIEHASPTVMLPKADEEATAEKNPAAGSPVAIDAFELASRLSLSLWSSLPDRELFEAARDGRILQDEHLDAQVHRMLRSPKARRMATEFFGQWLGFYQFDEFRGVDPKQFPEFDDRLRASLYDEAISFFEHIIRADRPYTEIFEADYTFLDQRSAQHYGIPFPEPGESVREGERHLEEVRRFEVAMHQRGGLLGLGAILTSTSAPLRTSPVKRGDWVLRRLVGTPVPPPPADAGSIPAEEVLADGMTVRQRLEMHRTRAECMNCHIRIDPLGFALENYDSLGRWRTTYLDQQEIDASGTLMNGKSIAGASGLKRYLAEEDESVRRTLATKLVAYFLGRADSLSDAALVENIASKLEDAPQISTAVVTLVQSPQFRMSRPDMTEDRRLRPVGLREKDATSDREPHAPETADLGGKE